MTRVGIRLFAALAAVAAAALLSACGGSGSDESASSSPSSSQAESSTEGGGAGRDKGQAEDGKSGSSSSNGKKASGKESGDPVGQLEVSGGGSRQFRAKGGDNSVQDYGDESSKSELEEVAEIVHDFYAARAEEKWDEACSYLAKSNIEQLEQLASQSPQLKGAGCAAVLKALTRPLPPAISRQVSYVDAGSFRHDSEIGFLIYYGPEKTVYSMPMRNEDGAWKVSALSGSAIG